MKIIHLSLKRECVLVELPEDDVARDPYGFDQTHIYHGHAPIVYHLKRGDQDDSTRAINLDMGYGWKLLGKFTDLKEEDFEVLVHWNEESQYYHDYRKEGWQGDITACESFISSIEAEGWYVNGNPYEKTPTTSDYDQEKVINLSNCYLFVKS